MIGILLGNLVQPFFSLQKHFFEHTEDGVSTELWVDVTLDAPVKLTVLNVHNGRAGRAGSPLPDMRNGCLATCGRNRPCT